MAVCYYGKITHKLCSWVKSAHNPKQRDPRAHKHTQNMFHQKSSLSTETVGTPIPLRMHNTPWAHETARGVILPHDRLLALINEWSHAATPTFTPSLAHLDSSRQIWCGVWVLRLWVLQQWKETHRYWKGSFETNFRSSKNYHLRWFKKKIVYRLRRHQQHPF